MPQITQASPCPSSSARAASGSWRWNSTPTTPPTAPQRQAHGMPYPQSPRPGLRQIQEAGDEWQAEKLHDLTPDLRPRHRRRREPHQRRRTRPATARSAPDSASPRPYPVRFLVEAEFTVGAGVPDGAGHHRPTPASSDLISTPTSAPTSSRCSRRGTFPHVITPDGTRARLPAGDARRQLRVIDVKLTAQAVAGLLRRGGLLQHGPGRLAGRPGPRTEFVVVPDGAVWPGSHEASRLFDRAQFASTDPDPDSSARHARLSPPG